MKIAWWQWLPFRPWRVVGTVEAADEIPKRLPRNGVALVGSEGYPKWIAFDCPCRSGHRIMLNADQARRPVWAIGANPRARLTVSPSIDFADRRMRCHYFIRKGKIHWAKDVIR